MWPKMLFELLPHVGRLVPMAEKFFATRGTRDQEEQAALSAIAENLRIELDKVAVAHAGVQRTLSEQSLQVSAVAGDLAQVRVGVASIEARLSKLENGFAAAEQAAARLEKTSAKMAGMFVVVVVLLVVVVLVSGLVLLRVWGR